MVAGQQLERDQRRPPAGGAFVLEPPPEQLDLLAIAELADRAVRDGALAVVRRASSILDLVLPLRPQVGQRALLTLFGEGRRLGSG